LFGHQKESRRNNVKPITINYRILEKQIKLLYSYRERGQNELLDGVIELLSEIAKQQPFNAVEEK
jgi:hypothetical protein